MGTLRKDIEKFISELTISLTVGDVERLRDILDKDADNKVGTTWLSVNTPCPRCGQNRIIGYLLTNEDGEHMHTRYICTFWRKGPKILLKQSVTKPCGWEGWSVPGWDDDNYIEYLKTRS